MTIERIDKLFARLADALAAPVSGSSAPASRPPGTMRPPDPALDVAAAMEVFESQLHSRWLDRAALTLRLAGEGHYTISSAGHEQNALLGRLTPPSDTLLPHYRSVALQLERGRAAAVSAPRRLADVVLALRAAAADPVAGGRHKVIGNLDAGVVPTTSTVASHLPRALGLAWWRGRAADDDRLVVASFGDASVNHASFLAATNTASWLRHQGRRVPLLLVCEDNGWGLSVPTPTGWVATRLGALPHLRVFRVEGRELERSWAVVSEAIRFCRTRGAPAVIHWSCPRLLSHAGSDVDEAYRPASDRSAAEERDPLLVTARWLRGQGVTAGELTGLLDATRRAVEDAVANSADSAPLPDSATIGGPVWLSASPGAPEVDATAPAVGSASDAPRDSTTTGDGAGRTLAEGLRFALDELLREVPEAILFGEDVGQKGGVYGVTRGLHERYGAARVFDTLLDEQTILGLGLGAALGGALPIVEIEYLGFLHNAIDQLRGELPGLAFLTSGRLTTPMIVRVAAFATDDGVGGPFHNDSAVGALREIPGLALAVPTRAHDAIALVRAARHLARVEGRSTVLLEPVALYHRRHLLADDGLWRSHGEPAPARLGRAVVVADAERPAVTIVAHGLGVWRALRVARELEASGHAARVLDLRWLAPLPLEDVLAAAREPGRLVIVDECRASGGVADTLAAHVLEHAPSVRVARVTAADCPVPLGPAARHVLVTEGAIRAACERLLGD